jgi:serine phosphatase RsbU (regulator of sigma subunit)
LSVRDLETTAPPGEALPLRVLLVEDDEGDAFLVEELLHGHAHAVVLTRARSLAEARALPPAEIDCALLDLNLPDASGLEALRALRGASEAPAILVLTGLADERRGIEAVAAGAQDYLVKGQVDGDALVRSIRFAVERRRAEQAERQLHAARLHAAENARLERGLLPEPLVDDPQLELVSHYRPGRRRALLGGDFYDAVQDAEGRVHVVIGDVCGHGPDEAALGVALRIAWRTLVLGGRQPGKLLGTLQDVLVAERQDPEVFTTVCMLSVAADRRSTEMRVAGHPVPLLISGATVEPLSHGICGPPLGVLAEGRWPAERVELPAEWSLLLYTDGLSEGRAGPAPQRLGDDGLLGLVAAARAGADGTLLREVVERAEALNGGPLVDDVAALLITRREP